MAIQNYNVSCPPLNFRSRLPLIGGAHSHEQQGFIRLINDIATMYCLDAIGIGGAWLHIIMVTDSNTTIQNNIYDCSVVLYATHMSFQQQYTYAI